MKPIRLLGLSILSGILLAYSWPAIGISYLIFFAWIPLLLIAETFLISRKNYASLKLYGYAFLSFLIWNLGATWWVVNASFEGALMAFLANSALMAGVFTLIFNLRKRFQINRSIWLLLPFWLAGEYLHHDWDLSWPWLTLGNVFAGDIQLIQWYEFTGTSGGSLWILTINILLLQLYRAWTQKQALKQDVRTIAFALMLPALVSLAMYFSWEAKGKTVQIAVIQPNVDPYNMKFNQATLGDQLDKMLQLGASVCDSSTAWLIGPETALARSIDESQLEESVRIQKIKAFQANYPKLNILIGAETHRVYEPGENIPSTARKSPDGEIRYDVYNTALNIQSPIAIYHKSKLVPGVEQMPFPWLFKYIEDYAINLGGSSGTLGKQDERTVFKAKDKGSNPAPAICYESVFGDFMTSYVRNGADFIAIITNDGWWGNTPGHKQHLMYASLRAIENRRDIARSANTGISCFVNQRGEILQAQPYWQEGAIKGNVHLNTGKTLFTITGDLIGKTSVLIALLVWIWGIANRFKKRKLKQH